MGQRLPVLAVSGIDDHDVGTAVTGHELLAADLVDDDHVGFGEVLHSADGHQARGTGTGTDEGNTTRMNTCTGRGGLFSDGRVRRAHNARAVLGRSGREISGWTVSK